MLKVSIFIHTRIYVLMSEKKLITNLLNEYLKHFITQFSCQSMFLINKGKKHHLDLNHGSMDINSLISRFSFK